MTSKRDLYIHSYRWFGILLIALGVLGLIDPIFDIRIGHFIWPFFILVPGVLMLVFSVQADSGEADLFSILGGMVTMLGLLLGYQNFTGHWASWAYAGVLVAPTGVGVGQYIYGKAKNYPGKVKTGKELIFIGLSIAAAGFVFFELILNIGGLNLGIAGWGVLLILLGAFTLLRPFASQQTE